MMEAAEAAEVHAFILPFPKRGAQHHNAILLPTVYPKPGLRLPSPCLLLFSSDMALTPQPEIPTPDLQSFLPSDSLLIHLSRKT